MPERLEEMPLFPLETVLFPFAALQLHIFEDRYRAMVHECVERDIPFGIVLIRSGKVVGGPAEPYMVGTAVRIQHMHTYQDGRMDIQVQGERRFRIRKLDFSKPFLVGYVEPVEEEEALEEGDEPELVDQARHGFEALIQAILSKPEYAVQVVFPPDPAMLSFTIANLLPLENIDKQRLLETTSTKERLRELVPILQTQLEEIDQNREMYSSMRAARVYRLNHEDLADWTGPN
jgi:Lon protease-like protein